MPSAYSVNDMENRYGDWNVTKVRVARRPLAGEFVGAKLLGWYAKKNNPAHDQVFHSYVEFALQNPETNEKKVIRVEKSVNNHAYEVGGGREELGRNKYEQALQIENVSGNQKLWEVLERTRRRYDEMGKKFDAYDLRTNNCQIFAETLLRSNGWWDESAHRDFVDQDASKIVPALFGMFANNFTDYLGRKERNTSGPALPNIHANNLSEWDYHNPSLDWASYLRLRGFSANADLRHLEMGGQIIDFSEHHNHHNFSSSFGGNYSLM